MLKKSLTVAASLVAVALVSGCYAEYSGYNRHRVIVVDPRPVPGPIIVRPIDARIGAIAYTRDVRLVSHNGEFDTINLSTYGNVPVEIIESFDNQITLVARVAGQNAGLIDGFMARESHSFFGDRLEVSLGGADFRCNSRYYGNDFYVEGVCLQRILIKMPAYSATRVYINGSPVSNPIYRPRIRPVPVYPVPAYPVPARPHRRGDVIIAPPSGGVIYAPGTGPHNRGRGNGGVPAVVVPTGRHRR